MSLCFKLELRKHPTKQKIVNYCALKKEYNISWKFLQKNFKTFMDYNSFKKRFNYHKMR